MGSLHAINLRLWLPMMLLLSFLAVQVISLVMSYIGNRNELVENSLEHTRRIAEQLHTITTLLATDLDLDTVRDIYSTYKIDPNISQLMLVDDQGVILHANQLALEGQLLQSVAMKELSIARVEQALQGHEWSGVGDQEFQVQVYRQVRLGTLKGSLRKPRSGVLILFYDFEYDLDEAMALVWQERIVEIGLWAVVMLALLFLVQRYTLRPVRALADATQKIAEGDFTQEPKVLGSGEIARLAKNFNTMTRSLKIAWMERNEREHFLQTTLLSIGDAVIVTDRKGMVVQLNPVAEQLTGWKSDEATGKPLQDVFHIINSKSRQTVESPVERVIREGGVIGLANHTVLVSRDKKEYQIADSAAPIRLTETSALLGVIMVFRDVTEEYRLHEEMQEQFDRLEAITQALPDMGFVLDEEGRYLEIMGGSQTLLPLDRDKVLGRRVQETLSEPVAGSVMDTIAKTLESGTPQRLEYELQLPGGRRWYDGRTAPLQTQYNGRYAVVWIATDITDRQLALQQIRKQAYYDELTGLLGRAAIRGRLQEELARDERHLLHSGLLYFDLDHFKDVNDSLGHDVGDEIIKVVADRVLSVVRSEDIVARLGGDEFVVLLTNLSDVPDDAAIRAQGVAEKIKNRIADPIQHEKHLINMTASIGITLFPQKQELTVADLLKQGDTAMYRAKSEGRNRVRFFTPSDQQEANRRFELVNALPVALVHDEQLALFLQPILDQQGVCVAAEGLMRWHHPDMGWVSPAEFIPIAEQSGLILELGTWAMERACQIVRMILERVDYPSFERLSINLSPAQFQQPDFGRRVMDILQKYQIDPGYIGMELTEEILVARPKEVREVIAFLRTQGIYFSIDDFGTGYSSLQYLTQLPLDSLKIDRSFIRDIATDRQDAIIVETVIQLARSMQLSVVAEGVEYESQLEFLMDQGCTNFQGYYFAHPMPVEDFIDYLNLAAAG